MAFDDISEARAPNAVDLHVGMRIRARRKHLEITQEELAAHLGLTFQQVQKYERGKNRVSASKLYETAQALSVPVAHFFEGLPSPETGDQPTAPDACMVLASISHGQDLAGLFIRLQPGDRGAITDLARRLAGDAEAALR